jgi:HAD superfamily hydrolase (TIGR01459 family)
MAPLGSFASSYDVVLSDIWGVIHNGSFVFPGAAEALVRFKRKGGTVILISNASRLSRAVALELAGLNMPQAAYDHLLTSGDIAREYIASNPGCVVFDVGPADAKGILSGLDVRVSAMEEADVAIASGAFEDDSGPEDMRPLLLDMISRGLLLICANPDLVTNIGGRQVKCSGSLAKLYAELGGKVVHTGKPEAPIYERALGVAAALRGAPIQRQRVLVIGDSIRTDIAGAVANGFDSLFVAGGIHAQETGAPESASSAAIRRLFDGLGFTPTGVTYQLSW